MYRGDPTPITELSLNGINPNFLRAPDLEKNFLISPPGSPPVGWEPIREDPPNSVPLADDLIAALHRLQLAERKHQSEFGSRIEVLLAPEDGGGIGVYVEDCDGDGDGSSDAAMDMDWAYGDNNPSRMCWKPMPTALPPAPWAAT